MDTYIFKIEVIECCDVYYPTKHIVEVCADDLKNALDKVFDRLNDGYDNPENSDFEDAVEDCENEWGINGYELTALAYNKTLDDNGSNYRILKGMRDGVEIFDLLDVEND